MKEQYVGDINDYRKFALLRRLSAGGRIRVGVCWMLTPPDDRSDGRKTGYLAKPDEWRRLDPELFDVLATLAPLRSALRIPKLEQARLLPRAVYYEEHVPCRPRLREAFFEVALDELKTTDLVFFDPDNGLNVTSVPKGRSDAAKYLFRDELSQFYSDGHSLLIYQHFPRESRDEFIRRTFGDITAHAPGAQVLAFKTSDIALLLLIHPRHATLLLPVALDAVRGWPSEFMTIWRPDPHS